MSEISRAGRQRLLFLEPPPGHDAAEWLTHAEFVEYVGLLREAGLIPDTPFKAGVTELIPRGSTRDRRRQLEELRAGFHNPPLTGRQAQLATLAARWPRRRLSGRQAICELERMRP